MSETITSAGGKGGGRGDSGVRNYRYREVGRGRKRSKEVERGGEVKEEKGDIENQPIPEECLLKVKLKR